MPPRGMKKGTQEMKQYMASLRARKGKGIMDMVKSGAKTLVKKGVDYGADYLKSQIGNGMKKKRGKGFIGDTLKFVGNKAVDMTGLGMMNVNAQGRLLKGSALYNAGM